MMIDTQNENLVVEVYQLLVNDNKNHAVITRTISDNFVCKAKNPLSYTINIIANNIHSFSQEIQNKYINDLIYSFKNKLENLRFLSKAINIFKKLILNLKTYNLKQLILDTLVAIYPKVDKKTQGLILDALQLTIGHFSEPHQKQILDLKRKL